MCSIFLSELNKKELGKSFLDFLDSFPKTKMICSMLRASDVETDSTLKLSTATKDSPTLSTDRKSETIPCVSSALLFVKEDNPIHSTARKNETVSTISSAFPSIKDDHATLKPFSAKGVRHTSTSSVHSSSDKASSRSQSPKARSSPKPSIGDGDSDAYVSAASNAPSAEAESSSREFLSSETVTTMSDVFPDQPLKPHVNMLPGPAVVSRKQANKSQPKRKFQNEKFEEAVKDWDTAQVDKLLTDGVADVEHLFKDEQTALMVAAIEGHKEMVSTLIRHKASVSAMDKDGQTALYHAASNGNYEALKILVGQPLANVNVKNRYGVPLLMEPALKGFSMVTEFLLEHGAKVNVEASYGGETPLYVACEHGNREVVKVLLDNNADVSKQCKKFGRTPLEEAVEGEDPEIVRCVMKAVAKINKKSHELFTCPTRDGIKSLVSSGAKVDTRNGDDATPLIVHAKLDHVEIVKELIRLRANVDLQDSTGYSALIVAAEAGSLELVQVLVMNGAILDLKEKKNGYTALMFGITKIHVGVVRELVLAKANVNIRNRDGKSSLDLARDGGNAEILEALQMTPTMSSGSDAFVNLLSTYMSEKGKTKKEVDSRPKTQTRRENIDVGSSSTYKSVVPEENSAHATEVKKYQKRIADLETRIHDLTIMGTMEIADVSDLTYMERGRLESEFRKLKESKKKAEQYAVEAKQTAQRLSAENFKLREDFNKERHFNELTRKNMMREVELDMERGVRFERMELVRSDVFQAEVAARAFKMVQSRGERGLRYESVLFTGEQLKKVIMEQSVQLDLFHLVIAGLPASGKSSLLKSLFNPTIQGASGINLYEAILHRNLLLGDEDNLWMEGSKLQSEVHTILMALAHFFAKQRRLPTLESHPVKIGNVFEDPEVQKYFETTHECLRKLLVGFETKDNIEKALTGSLSLINVFDVGVNKAVYEFMMAVRGRNRHILFVNVLNLFKYNKDTIMEPINLQEEGYKGRYSATQASMYNDHPALHHFVRRMEAVALPLSESTKTNTIVVGTHADKFKSDSERNQRMKEVMELIKAYSEDMGVPGTAYKSDMIAVDATKEGQCKAVRRALVELLDQNKSFKIDLPVKFVFLRYVLYCTKKVFMSRKELKGYAKKCGMSEASEVTEFLDIFRDCASIISSADKNEFLYKYVILLPIDFLRNLDQLFCISTNETMPIELRSTTQFGIVSKDLIRSLWQGSYNSSVSYSDLYVQVLKNVGLLLVLDEKYFIPSLRLKHDLAPVKSSSLVILSDIALTPFSVKQCMFVKYLTSRYKEAVTLNEECVYYNSVSFFWKTDKEEAEIIIRFSRDYIEVSVKPTNSSSSSENLSNLYSILKTDCVAIMNMISARKSMKYHFAIPCPYSVGNLRSQHFIPFYILDTSVRELKCPECHGSVSGKAELEWVKAAYQGSQKSAIHQDDVINPTNLIKLCANQLSSLTVQEIKTLHHKLSSGDSSNSGDNSSADEISFSSLEKPDLLFRVLYQWHSRNPSATKRHLALHIQECGLHKQAFELDSKLLNSVPSEIEQTTSFANKEIFNITASWGYGAEELAKVLKIDSGESLQPSQSDSDQEMCSSVLKKWLEMTEGDRREKLADAFATEGYPSISDVIRDLPIQ